MNKIRTLITSIGSTGSQGYLKSLDSQKFEFYGVDQDDKVPYQKLFKKIYKVGSGDSVEYIDQILKICNQANIDLILPVMEVELASISKNIEKFKDQGVKVLTSSENVIQNCLNKFKIIELLNNYGIQTPRVYTSKKFKYPFIVKPVFGSGSKGIQIVKNEKDHNYYYNIINDKKNIIQEYVSGVEYSFDGFADSNSKIQIMVSRIRIDVRNGLCYKSLVKQENHVIDDLKNKLEKMNLLGPFNLQGIKDENGKFSFFELNPRIGGTFILSVKAGLNLSRYIECFYKDEQVRISEDIKSIFMRRFFEEEFFVSD